MNKIRVLTTVKAEVFPMFRPLRTFTSHTPRFPVLGRFAGFVCCFDDRDEPELCLLKFKSVPRSKHTPSQLYKPVS